VGLTSGGLCCVSNSRLKESRGSLNAAQESAKGIVTLAEVGGRPERLRRQVGHAKRADQATEKNQQQLTFTDESRSEAPMATEKGVEGRATSSAAESLGERARLMEDYNAPGKLDQEVGVMKV
jgi:hypothetical protein